MKKAKPPDRRVFRQYISIFEPGRLIGALRFSGSDI